MEIPDGSCTWTTGIDTSKQIAIRAKNYPRVKGGTNTQTVIITYASAEFLFRFQTGNSYHVELAGIKFRDGGMDGGILNVSGSGSKVALIHDLWIESRDRYWPTQRSFEWRAQGGVLWNIMWDNSAFTDFQGNIGTLGGNFAIFSPRAWTTASTMGMADTNGTINVYLEDSTIKNASQFPDVDTNGRFVSRYNKFDGTWGTMHGFSSGITGRHVEYYNNMFYGTSVHRNTGQPYFWLRAGTGIWTENNVEPLFDNYFSVPSQLGVGESGYPPSGSWPMNMQPGSGHNGSSYISDPIYIWNQSGSRAYTYFVDSVWANYVQTGRDIFVGSAQSNQPKPGYSKYTYPHPLRTGSPPPLTNYHPADTGTPDNQISITELTTYAGCWKMGCTTSAAPNPIPISYVTRAGAIWKGTGNYRYEQTKSCPACWVIQQ